LHGLQLFEFLFGEKLSKRVEENNIFWFDALASAFSGKIYFYFSEKKSFFLVSKNLRSFGEKTRMSPDDIVHFRHVIEAIHDGRLEELPIFIQESVNQGLASLIEKLYESGFME
jgi:hypothetical protein